MLLSRVLRSSPLSSSFVFFSPDLLSLMPLLLYNQNDNTHYLREPKLEYLCIVHKSNCNLLQVTTTTTTNVYIKDEKEESKSKKIDHFRQGSLCNNRNDAFENIIHKSKNLELKPICRSKSSIMNSILGTKL